MKTDPYPYIWRTCFYINFHKTFFVCIKICKTFFSSKERQVNIQRTIDKKTDLKNGSLSISSSNTEKKYFMKIDIESSPPEIWIKKQRSDTKSLS